MNTPPKYEDLVLKVAELERREVAFREELELAKKVQAATDVIVTLAGGQRDRWIEKYGLLKQRLTVAEQRVSEVECFSVKQAALLEELGIPLDEVDDLFGEMLKNAKRYEYLRSVMAIEDFPGPHPEWSEPSEVESKRIDDLCDSALKSAAEGEGS